LYYHISSLDWE